MKIKLLGIMPFLFMSIMAHAVLVVAVSKLNSGSLHFGAVNVEMMYMTEVGSATEVENHKAKPQDKKRDPDFHENLDQADESLEENEPHHSAEASTHTQAVLAQPGTVTRWPRLLREEKVAYPHLAKMKGIEGEVTLKVIVGADGHPAEVEVLAGPGYGLNEAASQALRRFQFSPAYSGAKAVPTSIIYKYKFTIQD